jgi:hypothetical protein
MKRICLHEQQLEEESEENLSLYRENRDFTQLQATILCQIIQNYSKSLFDFQRFDLKLKFD